MSVNSIINIIKEKEVKFVDFRFTDTIGKEHHISVLADLVDANKLKEGQMFDGSSIAGWKNINDSDMILMPDVDSFVIDAFAEESTLIIRCDIIEPNDMKGYEKDPRSIAKKAEIYLKNSGIGDTAYFGNESEFFIFDSIRWQNVAGEVSYKIKSEEAAWESNNSFKGINTGHRPAVKGGYFPVPPVDSFMDLRAQICLVATEMGLKVELHHHEVGTAGQGEVCVRFNTLVKKSDETQIFKYCVHNVAHNYGKTATFMPKPIVEDNGSGMHVHQSIFKNGENLFVGNGYAGLSEMALFYIGGIIKHAKALCAFTNPSTNSYKRLVPGFEAPEMLTYSAKNRSAAVRIPYITNKKTCRIEVRFPDNTANPYLAFSAMLMAGIDGIKNKIHPGAPNNADLYALSAAEKSKIPTVAFSLEEALAELSKDQEFLLAGGVFTKRVIASFIELKNKEVVKLRCTTHPVEFEMYYSL